VVHKILLSRSFSSFFIFSVNSNEDGKESNELDYDEDEEDHLEEEQEKETGGITTATINQVF
jgi:hypothetical protein